MKFAPFAALAAAAVLVAPASAQNTQLMGGAFGAVTVDYVIGLFTSGGISAQYVNYESETHFIEVREGDLVAYIGLRGCDSAARTARCTLVQPYAMFNVVGLTLAHVNQLNLQAFEQSVAMLRPDNLAMVGCKLHVDGGVTEANLRNDLGRFFLDVASFVEGISPGAKAQVRFQPTSQSGYATPEIESAVSTASAEANSLAGSATALHAVAQRLTIPAQ
jgi:hypothetical protein